MDGVKLFRKPNARAARALKGKLMNVPSIFDKLAAAGYDAAKIPAWVARTSAAALQVAQPVKQGVGSEPQPAQAGSSPLAEVPLAAPTGSGSLPIENVAQPTIGHPVNPEKLELSQPAAAKPAKPAAEHRRQAISPAASRSCSRAATRSGGA